MKIVVQRVKNAQVAIKGKDIIAGKIDKGLLLLIGVGKNDTKVNAENLVKKILKLRIMADEESKMNLSIKDVSGGILAISQFTLYADTSKGNRPSFIKAADAKKAEEVYNHFVKELKKEVEKVETGEFGSYMNIETELDGPATILLEE